MHNGEAETKLFIEKMRVAIKIGYKRAASNEDIIQILFDNVFRDEVFNKVLDSDSSDEGIDVAKYFDAIFYKDGQIAPDVLSLLSNNVLNMLNSLPQEEEQKHKEISSFAAPIGKVGGTHPYRAHKAEETKNFIEKMRIAIKIAHDRTAKDEEIIRIITDETFRNEIFNNVLESESSDEGIDIAKYFDTFFYWEGNFTPEISSLLATNVSNMLNSQQQEERGQLIVEKAISKLYPDGNIESVYHSYRYHNGAEETKLFIEKMRNAIKIGRKKVPEDEDIIRLIIDEHFRNETFNKILDSDGTDEEIDIAKYFDTIFYWKGHLTPEVLSLLAKNVSNMLNSQPQEEQEQQIAEQTISLPSEVKLESVYHSYRYHNGEEETKLFIEKMRNAIKIGQNRDANNEDILRLISDESFRDETFNNILDSEATDEGIDIANYFDTIFYKEGKFPPEVLALLTINVSNKLNIKLQYQISNPIPLQNKEDSNEPNYMGYQYHNGPDDTKRFIEKMKIAIRIGHNRAAKDEDIMRILVNEKFRDDTFNNVLDSESSEEGIDVAKYYDKIFYSGKISAEVLALLKKNVSKMLNISVDSIPEEQGEYRALRIDISPDDAKRFIEKMKIGLQIGYSRPGTDEEVIRLITDSFFRDNTFNAILDSEATDEGVDVAKYFDAVFFKFGKMSTEVAANLKRKVAIMLNMQLQPATLGAHRYHK